MARYGKNPVRLAKLAKRQNQMLTNRRVVTLFQARYNTVEAAHEPLITREGNARLH
jgi:hypothetical protein